MTVGAGSRNALTASFLDGTARREFLLWRCDVCRAFSGPQAAQCRVCGSTELSQTPAIGDASVVSWTVLHSRPAADGSTHRTVLAVAELAEGPWWWSQIVDADPDSVTVGMPLSIDFEQADDDETVPVFRLSEERR